MKVLLILASLLGVAGVLWVAASLFGALVGWMFPKTDGRTFLDDERDS